MSVSVANQTLNETNLPNNPQLSRVPQSTNLELVERFQSLADDNKLTQEDFSRIEIVNSICEIISKVSKV